MGCPALESLVCLTLCHWDFDGCVRQGELEVSALVGEEVVDIFADLFDARFPIARMRPLHHYAGADRRSMADNNTSGFNCRAKVGSTELSVHSFGRAIDINPIQNPYETMDGRVLPPAGAAFSRRAGRAVTGTGVVVAEGPVVRAFESRGWTWGGRWSDPLDSHHFEKP
jgi:poly-gamma-glutamate synthesis protein (capsule biosynthesis protein)